MEKKNQVPKYPLLRFPEFTDEWKEVKLGEVCSIRTGKLNANAMEKDGQYPFFTCAKEVYRINTFAFSGEALLISGNGANVGYIHYYNGRFNAYQRTYVLEQFNQDIRCIQYLLVEHLSRRIAIEKNEGNTPYIVLSTLTDMLLRLPSLPEQRKIAALLSLIDERIEVQNAIIKEQEAQKAALLRRLFDRTLRFPEFTDEWTQTTIGEICKVSTGEMNTQDKIEDGMYPFYVRSSKIERANRYTYDGVAILTPGDGAIGQIFHYSKGKIAVHQRVYMLTEMQCIPKYLFHCFSARFFGRVNRMSAKNTVDSVRMNMITDMPIPLPSLAEQKKIAVLLSAIDERIAVETEYAALLQKQKAYLLRQMFV